MKLLKTVKSFYRSITSERLVYYLREVGEVEWSGMVGEVVGLELPPGPAFTSETLK